MRQARTTDTLKRQRCTRLEPQALWKDRNAPDSSHSHFEKTNMRQTQATGILKRQSCTRLEPQALWKDRHAPDSNHRHFEKTEMSQTRATGTLKKIEMHQTWATGTLKRLKCTRLELQALWKDRYAPDPNHSHLARRSNKIKRCVKKQLFTQWGLRRNHPQPPEQCGLRRTLFAYQVHETQSLVFSFQIVGWLLDVCSFAFGSLDFCSLDFRSLDFDSLNFCSLDFGSLDFCSLDFGSLDFLLAWILLAWFLLTWFLLA